MPDAAPLRDASPPDASPATSCGNGQLEPGEDCELPGVFGAGYGCLVGPTCGNGVLDADAGERCDDGNLTSGDGCSATCDSTEICGNALVDVGEECDDGNTTAGDGCDGDCLREVDPTRCGDGLLDPGETCDDGNTTPGDGCDDRCLTELAAPECGNGIVELGEQCDDGNWDLFDGCDDQCRQVQAFYLTSLRVADPAEGADLVGPDGDRTVRDCRVENGFATHSGIAAALGTAFLVSIAQGGILALLVLDGLNDPRGEEPSAVRAHLMDGYDPDGFQNNASGGAPFMIDGQDLLPDGLPEHAFAGILEDRWLSLTAPRFVIRVGLDNERLPFDFVAAGLRARLQPGADRLQRLTAGWLTGGLTARSLTALQNPSYVDLFRQFAGLERTYQGLLDVVVLGPIEAWGMPMQPDVDVDGDGLETFYADHPEDEVQRIDRCVDGDGTEYLGVGCVLRPEMADAFSLTLRIEGVWARLQGLP